ncbi:unnamed protein product [Arabis nemorensis]|uniref:Uncharacterized protein n=1 Tax=Arabis nemorensis TaxID=586526 RepID=A0A565BH33_9BRAS|nr:unnamed protein product [Arabis nemorensis]
MAVSQNDKNTRIAQKAIEMVDNAYGKSHKVTPKPYAPSDEFTSRFNQNSYKYGGPRIYTVKETTSTITARQVLYQNSNESTILKPVDYRPQYFGGTSPYIGLADRFEKQKERAISCDEAFQRYGGVLIKEFRK